jgi:hypothetical protein
VKAHQQIFIKSFSLAYGTSVGTIFAFLHEDHGLKKESASWELNIADAGPDGQESGDFAG